MFGLRGPFNNNFGDINVREIAIREIKKYFPNTEIEVNTRSDFKNKIDIVFDASGFAYGDAWGKHGLNAAEIALDNLESAPNARRVFLPQSWGPFGYKELIKHVQKMTKHALVFSRDNYSYRYLKDIGIRSILMPDLLYLTEDVNDEQKTEEIAICCNKLVQDRNENYISWFKDIVSKLDCKTNNFYSATCDIELAQQIGNVSKFEDIKKILKRSSVLISARLHPILYSLILGNTVVPIVWSHKYYETIDGYEIEELKVGDDISKLKDIIRESQEQSEKHKEITKKIISKAREIFPIIKDWIEK